MRAAATTLVATVLVAVTMVMLLAGAAAPCDAAIKVVDYNPKVPLSHCMSFGPDNNYQFEWNVDTGVKRVLEMRFTANVQRGYTSFGFTQFNNLQLVSGYPSESLACARRLYDNYSPYNTEGNVYASFPETPANSVYFNISHVSHYVMRNLSTSAKRMLDSGGSLATNVTLMWGYGLASMYGGACYNLNMSGTTEFAQMVVTFTDSQYVRVNGSCPLYAGATTSFKNLPQLQAQLLASERNQNTRMAGLLVGGDMLLQTGRNAPGYNRPPGYVDAGENYANVCQSSRSTLKVRWGGFVENVGGVQRYEVTAGTQTQPSLFLDRGNAGTNLAYTFGGLSIPRNTTMFVSVTAFNFAGLGTTIGLPPMRVLNNFAPVFGAVLDGTVIETLGDTVPVQYIRSLTRLAAHWNGYIAHDHSNINANTSVVTETGYQFAVGLSGLAADSFQPWTAVGVFEVEKILTGLTLLHGKRYYFTIRTTNCAGVQTLASSAGVTVDVVSPSRGRVFLSNTTYKSNAVIKKSNRIAVSWVAFSDATSGIAFYEYAVGKTPKPLSDTTNLGMIVNWTPVGLKTQVLGPSIYQLPPATQALVPLGTFLYAYVKATDRAGNYAIAFSNSTKVVAN